MHLEIIRLPSNNFHSKCGEIHCYDAIFSINCNFCGLQTNSFEQFCQHFRDEHNFELAEAETILAEDAYENEDVQEMKSEVSDVEIIEGITEFSNIKNDEHIVDFELVKFENHSNNHETEEETVVSPKEKSSLDDETLIKIEIEVDNLLLELAEQEITPVKKSLELAEQEITPEKKSLKRDRCKNKIPFIKKIRKRSNKPTNRIFNCKHCDRPFNNKSNRNMHELRHKDIGDFHCNLCTKIFYSNDELTKHMRSHNDERPYVCEQCGKAFRHTWVLTKHSRTHTAQKRNLPCSTCGKLFASKDTLRNHLAVHNTIPICACEYCNQYFTSRKRLWGHKQRCKAKV